MKSFSLRLAFLTEYGWYLICIALRVAVADPAVGDPATAIPS